jgi:hypothetical protein
LERNPVHPEPFDKLIAGGVEGPFDSAAQITRLSRGFR